MIFQKVDAWGDSLTFGARTYGCWPLSLSELMREATGYEWLVRNKGVNSETARDLWFRMTATVEKDTEHHAAIVLIGTNDAKKLTPPKTFAAYYEQMLVTLVAHGWTPIVGTIPLIVSMGRLPYTRASETHREKLNAEVLRVATARGVPIVDLQLTPSDLCDGVHLNDDGNARVARAFTEALLSL
jgi:lysophospholipase L1-like esterase